MGARCLCFMVAVACTLLLHVLGQDTIQQHCDPRTEHQTAHCPTGYCCVRDEFLPSWVYCKRVASEHEDCATRPIETNCPCNSGLECQPNVVNADGTASLYGRCVNSTTATTPCPHGSSCHDPLTG